MALDRIGDAAPMDELTYTYAPTDNRLQRVDDQVIATACSTDVDAMTTDFTYYRNGNLQNDPTANIANILWHPNGKLNAIIRDGANDSPTLVFSYDGLGNRVRKVQVARDASGNTLPMAQWDITYYIRDAQGNHLTTIGRKMTETDEFEATDELNITETVMYGSDRLGVRLMLPSWQGGAGGGLIARQAFTHSGASTEGEYQDITPSGSPVYSTAPEDYFSSLEGAKHYELKNHLGNVLATVSDKRDVEVDGSDNVLSYTPVIDNVSFYYPFGSLMPEVSNFGGGHRFGFNGQERVDEVKNVRGAHNTALFWEYDSRLARRWNLDPIDQISISNYSVFANSPLFYLDKLGNTVEPTTEGAKKELEKYGDKTYLNEKGREKENKMREPAFAEIVDKWKADQTVLVKFTTISDKEFGGSIDFEGINEDGQKVYNVMWDPSQTEKLGASGIFEETFHLKEALEGTYLAFDEPHNGTPGLDIYDEVRAKMWVAQNISIRETFNLGEGAYGYTHYGWIKNQTEKSTIARVLMNGSGKQRPLPNMSPSMMNQSFGQPYVIDYEIPNMGGRYKSFSTEDLRP